MAEHRMFTISKSMIGTVGTGAVGTAALGAAPASTAPRTVNPVASSTTSSSVNAISSDTTNSFAAEAVAADAAVEQACVRAVLAGDRNAYQHLIEAHQSRVFHLALRLLGNEREAEDAAQDAFLQAYTKLASYNPEWRFKTWVMTITNNLCIDRLRRRKLEPTTFSDYAQPTDSNGEERELEFVSSELPPDAAAAQNEQRRAVGSMLQQLPAEDRSMVVMFYWDDMSYEDIAKTMLTTVSAVKSRLFRARRTLSQMPMAATMMDPLGESRP